MDYSNLYGNLKSKNPQNSKDHMLYEGGFIESIEDGLNLFLPLGWKVVRNVVRVIREELEDLEGQEIRLPFVMPLEFLKKSARAQVFGKELAAFKNREGQHYVLPPAREEAISELIKTAHFDNEQNPLLLFELQSRYRDFKEANHKLFNCKESLRVEAWSFHKSFTGLNNYIPKIFATFDSIFKRFNIDYLHAEGSTDFTGGEKAYDFFIHANEGNQEILECSSCGYFANKKIAQGIPPLRSDNPLPMKKVKSLGVHTPTNLAKNLNCSLDVIADSTVYSTPIGFYMTVIRADYQISETKLARFLKVPALKVATKEELNKFKLVFESLSPIDLNKKAKKSIKIIVDETIANSTNLAYGSNKRNYYYQNGNFGVDYDADLVADIATIKEGDICRQCSNPLSRKTAIEFAKIYKIGAFYSRQHNLKSINHKGREIFLHMGSYYIDLTRLISAITLQNTNENGLIWPDEIAPFRYYFIVEGNSITLNREKERIYSKIRRQTIIDLRDLPISEKENEAKLLGIPYLLILTDSFVLNNQIQIKIRKTGQTISCNLEVVLEKLNLLSSNNFLDENLFC